MPNSFWKAMGKATSVADFRKLRAPSAEIALIVLQAQRELLSEAGIHLGVGDEALPLFQR